MRLSYTVFVVVAALLSSCNAASVDSIKLPTDEVRQTRNAVLTNDNRFLRNSDTNTDEEERAINWSKLFDFKKLFGATKKIPVKNEADDFAMQTVANMIGNKKTRNTMFTQWDLYTIKNIEEQLGAKILKQPKVQRLMKEYNDHRAKLKISP